MTWATAKRRADKAAGAIGHAIDHLCVTCTEDDYAGERHVMAAIDILNAASVRIHEELRKTRKSLGVGIYQPYGRNFTRKY